MAKIYYFKVNNMEKNTENKITVHDVAKTFLTFDGMTPKKLQKLCYYAYSWHLTLTGYRMFEEKFQAWVHGPVAPSLYQEYRHYGWLEIPKQSKIPEVIIENEDILETIQEVYDSYGDLTGDELEALTHEEDPWLIARNGLKDYEPSQEEISDEVIVKYYSTVYEEGQND